VVNSSVTGKFGTPFRSSYAASKHALHGFFESLRAELWGEGIRVTIRLKIPAACCRDLQKSVGSSDNGRDILEKDA